MGLALVVALSVGEIAGAEEPVAEGNAEVSSWVAPPLPKSIARLGLEVAVVTEAGERVDQKSLRGVSTVSLKEGSKHGIALINHNPTRVWLVIAVDGLNPTTGKRSYIAQPGLVLKPGETVTLHRTRVQKKGDLVPLFESQAAGDINIGIFEERRDYPFITPGMSPPPYGPETFVVDAGGRRWVPPPHFPFRKNTEEPAAMVYFRYERLPQVP